MNVYLLRKHPPHPYSRGPLEAFTIAASSLCRKEIEGMVKEKNAKSSSYFYTVGILRIKGGAA